MRRSNGSVPVRAVVLTRRNDVPPTGGPWMKILDRLRPSRHDARILELAQNMAAAQHDRLWEQVAPRAGSLASVPEAQGYIRFYATHLLKSESPQLLDPSGQLDATHRVRVVERAVELLVAEFVGRLVRARPAAAHGRQAA